jgi:hypothetical protein
MRDHTGFYGPELLNKNLNQLTMQKLSNTKSEFMPGASSWRFNKSIISLIQNLTSMKKQIFLLLVLTLFIGILKTNAQCTGSEITPAPGIEYNYPTTISGPGYTGTGQYDWYVTQDVNVLANIMVVPNGMFTVNGATPYHNPATGVNHIQLTWTASATGQTFYLVLRYRENNSTTTCSAENIRVWEIKSLNSFLLALAPGLDGFTCAADATGAVVTPANPSTVLLTYGNNSLYYAATASGILGNWKPWVRIPALQTTQVYVSVDWTYDMTGSGNWHSFNGLVPNGSQQDLQSPDDAAVSDAVNGTPILIRVVINNNNWQTLADQAVTLAVDGYLAPDYTTSDIINSGPNPCDPAPAFFRTADFTVKARPTINSTVTFLLNTNP